MMRCDDDAVREAIAGFWLGLLPRGKLCYLFCTGPLTAKVSPTGQPHRIETLL
jgi:hypothetical protein